MKDFDARFEQLRARFAAKAAQDAAELERLLAARRWPDIRDLAHRLAGRAGMFGHGGIGDIACEVEEGIGAGADPVDRLAELIRRLRAIGQER